MMNKINQTLTTGAVVSFAIVFNASVSQAASFTPQLIQESLFFGRNILGKGEVSENQFQGFVNNTVTPRFPDGLTIFDANGQFRDSSGKIIREKSKNLTLFTEDNPRNTTAINDIARTYIQNFNQESVLRVTNKDNLKVSFGQNEDLFSNSPIPKFIKVDLFFGRNIPGGGEVSEEQFQGFINDTITPRFPDGLTVFDANGQFRDSKGTIIRERTKNVSLLLEDTPKNETSVNEVVRRYVQQFNQESVLQAANEKVKVSFGLGEDLFDNSPTPKPIKVDLFFGRNISGDGEVSEDQFQGFLNNVITPRFPDGLTIFDVNGQFRDNTGTIIKEKSKNVSLLLEDTFKNETSINDVVRAYVQQFRQESVLQVVDENVEVSFISSQRPISVPEPSLTVSLLTLGVLGTSSAFKKKFTAKKVGKIRKKIVQFMK
jgi:Protein of unknown function (DUF3574)